MNEIIIALALLSAPPPSMDDDGKYPAPNPAENLVISYYSPLIRQFAIRDELLDPRELRYVLEPKRTTLTLAQFLGLGGSIRDDLSLLQRRQEDLYNAPAVADSQRFPDRADVNEVLAFNQAVKKRFDESPGLAWDYNGVYRRGVMAQCDELYIVWDTVRDTRTAYYYITVRRQALKRLRDDLIGQEAYYTGQLPPPVPLWLFQEIK